MLVHLKVCQINLLTYLIHSLVEGDDYVFMSNSVVFSPTSSASSMESAQVQIVDDLAVEGDHDFTVTIAAVGPVMIPTGSPASVTVTILDNDGTSACLLFTSDSFIVCQFCSSQSGYSGNGTTKHFCPGRSGLNNVLCRPDTDCRVHT